MKTHEVRKKNYIFDYFSKASSFVRYNELQLIENDFKFYFFPRKNHVLWNFFSSVFFRYVFILRETVSDCNLFYRLLALC